MQKLISTLITVVVAVSISGAIWVGANLLFSQVQRRWSRFSVIAGACVGFILGALLSGNRVLIFSDGADGGLLQIGQFIWFPLVAALIAGIGGGLLSTMDRPGRRLAIGVGTGVALGVLAGALARSDYYPGLEILPLLGWTAGVAAVGAGVSLLLGRRPLGGLLVGAALGWTIGAWGAPELGVGNPIWTIVAMTVPLALLGAWVGTTDNPGIVRRAVIDQKSRGAIFLGPALLFIFATLVVPAIRTIYLSLLDRRSENFVWFQNYVDTFTDRNSFDPSGFATIFGSRLFWLAIIVALLGAVVGARTKARTGKFVELGSASSAPLVAAALLFCFALFTALRGTIINNLWWVVVVVFFSTAIGLAVAVLADGVRFEKVAKSTIFMPMAISLVGASIIWRFMYQARDTSTEQTGVLNAVWVGLGRLSTGEGLPTLITGVVAVLVTVALLALVGRALTKRNYGAAVLPGLLVLLAGWFTLRFYSAGGVGGVIVQEDGTTVSDTILFIQEPPFNNFWLMLVLVWIQTGFAMVILSAAIKAVPEELLDAARVDGATETQMFWRITLPQIATTIGVVVTTLIVLVMKVFDIVKVMTNGQFGTQVLANDMFSTAFNNLDTGRGAALAILILLSVLPVMVYNVRQMQEEA